MNVLLIAVLVILLGAVGLGYKRGFIRIAFSLVSMVLVILLVSLVTPPVTGFLKEHTTIYADLSTMCAERIQQSFGQPSDSVGEAAGGEAIEGLKLPKVWADQLVEKAGGALNQAAEESGVYQYVGDYIADWILRGIVFLTAFVVVSIVLRLVVGLLDLVAKLPLIKGANKLLGSAAGLVQGLLIVWVLFFLIAVACTSRLGQTLLGNIEDSAFLTFLYEHNGLLYLFHFIFG